MNSAASTPRTENFFLFLLLAFGLIGAFLFLRPSTTADEMDFPDMQVEINTDLDKLDATAWADLDR